MNPLRMVWLFNGILALASAYNGPIPLRWHSSANSIKDSLKATDWMPMSELESLPPMYEMTVERLEEMPLREGAEWHQKMYHLSQAGRAFEAKYVPRPSEISAYYFNNDNKKVNFKLNELPKIAVKDKNFGNEEVTIYITGLPETTKTVKKATRQLVEAYMQRYSAQTPKTTNIRYEGDNMEKKESSSSEEEEEKNKYNKPTGTLIVIELGNLLKKIEQYLTLDVERTGMIIGDILVELSDKSNVPYEIIHVIGSNVGAHVAGAAGRHFTQETGHKLRRITGLDPSRIFAQTDRALRGLARGDAEFVDVIHTSAYGLGTATRCGDADFYPNGPGEGVPGADNVIDASMRAVRYYAETVVPGNERNFPAVGATSLKQYKEQRGIGKRVYMGIDTDYDVEGDFMLEVNSKSPFGRRSPAQRQQNYHDIHMPSKMQSRDY